MKPVKTEQKEGCDDIQVTHLAPVSDLHPAWPGIMVCFSSWVELKVYPMKEA